MATIIKDYELEGELSMRDAGNSRWGFCSKGGHSYYIKEFLSPVWPEATDELSPRLVERRRRVCEVFYQQKCAFYDALMQCRTGNNMVVYDFFRWRSHYYVVTDRVYAGTLRPADVARLSDEKKMTFLRALLHSVAAFHAQGIAHADLKPDNLLVKHTTDGYMTAKIIDFDAGFMNGNAPAEVPGDFVYLAPEARLRMDNPEVPIDCKIDVFALGLLMHQYWTGEVPSFSSKYHYAFEAVLNNADLVFAPSFPLSLRVIAAKALAKNPADRPSAAEMLQSLGVSTRGAQDTTSRYSDSTKVHEHSTGTNHRKGFYVPSDLD